MEKLILLFMLILLSTAFSAQQLTPYVVSSSGGFYVNSSGMLSFTTCEMSALETFTSPTAILTQGFQQYWDMGTSIDEHHYQFFSVDIYPNPSQGYFNLVTEAEVNEYVDLRMFDLLGNEIYKTSYFQNSGLHIESFDFSKEPQGIYVVAFTIQQNNTDPAYHFVKKINIIK
ncbi:MAG TPA: T9SS type A sorting domain-containing protein [Saprospiraceae bacterium]|nr:T9SS type A sorting domain-containing protein [Saprospiraceae bacterium]